MIFYKCFKAVLRVIFIPLFAVKRVNKEKFPKEGGCVLCSNHLSNWDPFFMHLAIDRKPMFMAKKELFKNPLLRGIIKGFGAFSVDRGNGDLGAMQNAFKIAEEGNVVGIYPEGTRAKDGVMKKFHPGAVIIALRTGVPICPMYISRRFGLFRKTYMVLGDPIDIKALYPDVKISDREKVREISEYVRGEVLKLKDEIKK